MALPQPLAKLVLGGSLYNGAEIWSLSFSLHPFSATPTELKAQPLWNDAVAWFQNPMSNISSRAVLQEIKVNRVNELGHYSNPSYTERYAPPLAQHAPGSSSTVAWPQLAVAVSLRTPLQRGPGSVGRFYPPLPAVGMAADTGRITPTAAQSMADSAARFIDAINARYAPWTVVVASAVNATAVRVTRVEVGDVMDTQRRRRNRMREIYRSAVVANTATGTAASP